MARTLERQFIQERAYSILKNAYGPGAQFHPGQLDAIVSVVSGRDSLVVEKTGWGKSLVYFVSTKILRENGAGPTLIISPLLALMENQVESARIFGVDAITVNSDNKDQWDDIYRNLNRVDALIVSPERLSNEQFMRHLAEVPGIELVVVDEAHSISDWGHDFRPDYQRVSKIIDGLPGNVTVLGTTATANDRVISDIKEQMGGNLEIVRGDLIREKPGNPGQSAANQRTAARLARSDAGRRRDSLERSGNNLLSHAFRLHGRRRFPFRTGGVDSSLLLRHGGRRTGHEHREAKPRKLRGR